MNQLFSGETVNGSFFWHFIDISIFRFKENIVKQNTPVFKLKNNRKHLTHSQRVQWWVFQKSTNCCLFLIQPSFSNSFHSLRLLEKEHSILKNRRCMLCTMNCCLAWSLRCDRLFTWTHLGIHYLKSIFKGWSLNTAVDIHTQACRIVVSIANRVYVGVLVYKHVRARLNENQLTFARMYFFSIVISKYSFHLQSY